MELPLACPPYPVALIHVGSGPTDRDGNSRGLRNDALKLLAEALAAGGIASVRYDKRGIAASAPAGSVSERDLRFSHDVDDAGRWLEMLATDQRFSRRVLIGHSEGSLIGTLAIQGHPGVGFASIAGPGRPAGVVLREQLAKQLTGTLLAQENEIIAESRGRPRGRFGASITRQSLPAFGTAISHRLVPA